MANGQLTIGHCKRPLPEKVIRLFSPKEVPFLHHAYPFPRIYPSLHS